MTLSRGKLFIRFGSYSIAFGVLCAWASDRRLSSPLSEIFVALMFILVVLGILALSAGCVVFCVKETGRQLLRTGAIFSGVALIVIPAATSLTHFEPNVHEWTGILFFLWLLFCFLALAILLVGFLRNGI
jgi:hypothetical protein